jgi:hypothetical protein
MIMATIPPMDPQDNPETGPMNDPQPTTPPTELPPPPDDLDYPVDDEIGDAEDIETSRDA